MIQRVASIALSLAAVVLSAMLAFNSSSHGSERDVAVRDAGEAPPKTGANATAIPSTTPNGTATAAPSAAPIPNEAPTATPPALPEAGLPDRLGDAPLPTSAPRHVRFGVVLVTYEGAEGAEHGARAKSAALSIAERLAEDAKGDFHSAVQHGDSGSADDVGRIDRGVLEPSTEAVVFALPVGQTSGVIDTPRGFWIVKRLD